MRTSTEVSASYATSWRECLMLAEGDIAGLAGLAGCFDWMGLGDAAWTPTRRRTWTAGRHGRLAIEGEMTGGE